MENNPIKWKCSKTPMVSHFHSMKNHSNPVITLLLSIRMPCIYLEVGVKILLSIQHCTNIYLVLNPHHVESTKLLPLGQILSTQDRIHHTVTVYLQVNRKLGCFQIIKLLLENQCG